MIIIEKCICVSMLSVSLEWIQTFTNITEHTIWDWLQYSFSSQLLDSYPTKHQTNVFVYWCHVTVDARSIQLLSTAHFDTAAPKAGGNAPNLFKGYACKSASPEEGYK